MCRSMHKCLPATMVEPPSMKPCTKQNAKISSEHQKTPKWTLLPQTSHHWNSVWELITPVWTSHEAASYVHSNLCDLTNAFAGRKTQVDRWGRLWSARTPHINWGVRWFFPHLVLKVNFWGQKQCHNTCHQMIKKKISKSKREHCKGSDEKDCNFPFSWNIYFWQVTIFAVFWQGELTSTLIRGFSGTQRTSNWQTCEGACGAAGKTDETCRHRWKMEKAAKVIASWQIIKQGTKDTSKHAPSTDHFNRWHTT